MKLTAKVGRYSSVVGGHVALADPQGRIVFMISAHGTTNGISKEQDAAISSFLADKINAAGGIEVPEYPADWNTKPVPQTLKD